MSEVRDDLKTIRQFTFRGIDRVAGFLVAKFAGIDDGKETVLNVDTLRARRRNLAEQGYRCEASDLAIGLLEQAATEEQSSSLI